MTDVTIKTRDLAYVKGISHWCRKNLSNGTWEWHRDDDNGWWDIHFDNDEDALAFKLKFDL